MPNPMVRLNDMCKPSRTVSQKPWKEEKIPHLALLAYITTPLTHNLPAELLNSRKFRCLLPIQIEQHEQTRQQRQIVQRMKLQQAKHYNKNARDLPKLNIGDTVYVQLKPNIRKWTPGMIVPHRTREFENIQCPDHTWRMVHKKQKILQSKAYKQSATYNTKYQVCTPTSSTSMTRHTRPRCTIRKPQRLIET